MQRQSIHVNKQLYVLQYNHLVLLQTIKTVSQTPQT